MNDVIQANTGSSAKMSAVFVAAMNCCAQACTVNAAAVPRSPVITTAAIDGASAWQRLRKITFPLLLPTTVFLLIFQTILGMQTFDQIFVMTNGGPPGPGGATTTVTYYIWLNAFRYFKMGYASALAWTLFAVIFVLSLIQFRWYLKRVER